MKWLRFPLFVLILFGAMGARCRGAELRVEAIGHTTRVIYHSPETPGYTSWVGLWQLPDGRLRYDFLQLTGPRKKPLATVPIFESRDGGDTWTHVTDTPTEVVLSPEGYLTVSKDSGRGMAVLPDGTLVRPVWPPVDEKASGYVERSVDGGKTWAQRSSSCRLMITEPGRRSSASSATAGWCSLPAVGNGVIAKTAMSLCKT